jgi:hypothetical protein
MIRIAAIVTVFVACSNGTAEPSEPDASVALRPSAPVPESPGDPETPATGAAQTVATWIASGAYRAWRCEPAGREARAFSPHARNRVCNNAKVVAHGKGEYPVGAASVKELFDDLGALTGHAVAVKIAPGGAESWIWYVESGGSVPVNGRGDAEPAATKCTPCHAAAGTPDHTGHDFVYTQLTK